MWQALFPKAFVRDTRMQKLLTSWKKLSKGENKSRVLKKRTITQEFIIIKTIPEL